MAIKLHFNNIVYEITMNNISEGEIVYGLFQTGNRTLWFDTEDRFDKSYCQSCGIEFKKINSAEGAAEFIFSKNPDKIQTSPYILIEEVPNSTAIRYNSVNNPEWKKLPDGEVQINKFIYSLPKPPTNGKVVMNQLKRDNFKLYSLIEEGPRDLSKHEYVGVNEIGKFIKFIKTNW